MPDENRKTLSKLRLEQARECLESAQLEMASGYYRGAANRNYYCCFHTMRAVLAIDGFDSKRHQGIIAAFRQKYIKTGIFPANFSNTIKDAFENRGKSDYDDFFIISKEATAEQIENTKNFLEAVEEFITTLQSTAK